MSDTFSRTAVRVWSASEARNVSRPAVDTSPALRARGAMICSASGSRLLPNAAAISYNPNLAAVRNDAIHLGEEKQSNEQIK